MALAGVSYFTACLFDSEWRVAGAVRGGLLVMRWALPETISRASLW